MGVDEMLSLITQEFRHYFSHVVDSANFRHAPGSADKHHNWSGGLRTHTLEVANIAIKMAEIVPCDMSVLLTATAWHDYGKIVAYEYVENSWRKTAQCRLTGGHLARSYAEFLAYAKEHNGPPEFVDKVAHCILAHHQLREWGSPASPQCNEAWVLHLADMASARCLGGEHAK